MTYSGPSQVKSTRAGPGSPRRSKCETSRRPKPREVAVQLVEASRDRDSCGEQDPEAGLPGVFRVPVTNSRRGTASGRTYGSARGDALERRKPQERDRHETRPAGDGRIKTSRA